MEESMSTPVSRSARRGGRWLPALVLLCLLPGCFTFTHTVGNYEQTPGESPAMTETRWFALWGLVSFGSRDVREVANYASDYRAVTEMTFIDILISSVPAIVGFYRQSIKIYR